MNPRIRVLLAGYQEDNCILKRLPPEIFQCLLGFLKPTTLFDKYPKKVNWFWLSKNPSITPGFIETHLNQPWDWSLLSLNPSITPEFIESHPGKPWNWCILSTNPVIFRPFYEW